MELKLLDKYYNGDDLVYVITDGKYTIHIDEYTSRLKEFVGDKEYKQSSKAKNKEPKDFYLKVLIMVRELEKKRAAE